MRYGEHFYHWQWELQSSPETLWPFVADTQQFNRDVGAPPVNRQGRDRVLSNARLRLRQRFRFGLVLDYVQEPYEWIYPYRYGIVRRYDRGIFAELRTLVQLAPQPEGGTRLTYDIWVRPRSLLGWLILPVQVGWDYRRSFGRTFRQYDRIASGGKPPYGLSDVAKFVPGGRQRLEAVRRDLLDAGSDPGLLARLVEVVEQGDPLTLARLRPYALADYWGVDRRDVLRLCLLATRYGLLDLRWDLLCPLCRGAQDSVPTLGNIRPQVHCDTCNIDFEVNFERSIEVTFRPNPAIRAVEEVQYCVGGPHDTPHIVVQQLLAPGERRALRPVLEPGRYRLRTLAQRGGQYVVVMPGGLPDATLSAYETGWPDEEIALDTAPELVLENQTGGEQLFVLERLAWTEQAATAAEVTLLQVFRDLFASEALRPGEQVSVGKLAVVFTDLRNSTGLYREIGDAPAFGIVMDHFDVLRDAVIAEDGAIVKTLGDSVMAVFRRPAAALRAVLTAQQRLAQPDGGRRPLILKAGIHFGACIAVTLNDRLDYFGSTVNIAARLQTLSQGDDVIVSRAVCDDPEVAEWLDDPGSGLIHTPVQAVLKGFDQEHMDLCRVQMK